MRSPDRGIRSGVRRLFRLPLVTSNRIRRDADEELRAIVAERIDDLVTRGMSPAAARAEALRRLGAPLDEASAMIHQSALHRERRMRINDLTQDFLYDVRHAARTLRRDLAFAMFATVIIGLGIGATVTVFSVVNALFVRPLPFRQPDRLTWITAGKGSGLSAQTTQVGNFQDFAAQNQSFAEVAAYFAFYGVGDHTLSDHGRSLRLSAVPVSQNFFPLLGVRPELGRLFTPAEAAWQGPNAVLLSHDFWMTHFGGDPAIVGRPITIDDSSWTVIGVLPKSFDFGSVFAPGTHMELFIAFPLSPETNRWGNTLSVVGRLKPGVTLAAANAELEVLGQRITAANRSRNDFHPVAVTLRDHVSGHLHSALLILALGVVVVMLIVCANLSNLLLARATARGREMAIRAALGAGRGRIARQMLTESVLLSGCGALLGLVLAVVGTRAVSHLDAVALPLLGGVAIDGRALALTVALALAAGIAFGLAPAMQAAPDVGETLKASGRALTDDRHSRRVRGSLVVAEIALACMLLVGAGLLVRSFIKVLDVDLGFQPARLSALRVDPDQTTSGDRRRFIAYIDGVLLRARSIAGVQSAALSDGLPLGSNRSWGVRAKGATYRPGELPNAFVRVVSEGYVTTMGIPLRYGRDFTAQDGDSAEQVIVINETAARTLWPNQNALGRIMRADHERKVVGVVADVRHLALEQTSGLEMYLPLRQSGDYSSVTLVVRSAMPAAALAASLRNALQPTIPNLATNDLRTLSTAVDKAVSPRRFVTLLLGGFAAFALVLALLGIYGVISYTVSNRTREIGVRIALGASAVHVQRDVLRDTLVLAAAGMVVGSIASWMLARLMGGFLFGVSPADPATFAAMLVTLTVVALVAGYVPARRASHIDPCISLREG